MKLQELGRRLQSRLIWSLVPLALLIALILAGPRYASQQVAAHDRWGKPITGKIVARQSVGEDASAMQDSIAFSVGLVQLHTPALMFSTYQVGDSVTLWRDDQGKVFVRDSYHFAGDIFHREGWRSTPWPNTTGVYLWFGLIGLLSGAALALLLFGLGSWLTSQSAAGLVPASRPS